MSNEKSYLESLPIQELVDFRKELTRQIDEVLRFRINREEQDFCSEKILLINREIDRRKNLIQ